MDINDFKTKYGIPLKGMRRKIMEFILENGPSRSDQIAESIGKSPRHTTELIAELRECGFIKKLSTQKANRTRMGVYDIVRDDQPAEPESNSLEEKLLKDGAIARTLKNGGIEIQKGNSRTYLLTDRRHVATDTIGRNTYFGHGGGTGIDCNINWPSR